MTTVFIVRAHRNGDRTAHTYTAGIYPNLREAAHAAAAEVEERGGKYGCTISTMTDPPREVGALNMGDAPRAAMDTL